MRTAVRRVTVYIAISGLVAGGCLPVAHAAPAATAAPAEAALEKAPAAVILGQTGAGQVSVNGHRAPSGTTLFSPAELRAGSRPAVIYLAHGEVVHLAPGTRASMEEGPDGRTRIAVLSGNVTYRDGNGILSTAPAESSVVLAQLPADDQPPPEGIDVGEPIGEPLEAEEPPAELVRLCYLALVDPEPELVATCAEEPTLSECLWEPMDVPAVEAPSYLARPDVVAPGPESGLNEECKEDDPAAALLPRWLLIGAGAAVVGVALWQILEDDEQPVTPVRP